MSNLKAMNTALEKARNVKEVFTIDFVAERAIKNYEAVTGRKDAQNWYQKEVLSMMAIFAEKPDLGKCDKMSIWGCLMKAGRLGLSIADGQMDLIPYGQILKAEENYKGMRAQLRNMPSVKFVSEAQVVFKGDEFEHDKLNNRVVKHISKTIPATMSMENIEAAYVRLEFEGGRIADVVMYKPELIAAKNKSKNKAESGPWAQNTGEMCKKSVVKRAKKIYWEPSSSEIVDAEFKQVEADETQDTTHEEVQAVEVTPEPEVAEPVKQEAPVQEAKVVKKGSASNMQALMEED